VTDRDAFGPRLRREREGRGITLESIAQSTKISIGLLAALERNDVSRWPAGIFRRAFLREYAAAIGLSSESTLSEFLRLFPEPGVVPGQAPRPAPEGLRLTLEPESSARTKQIARQSLAAVLDLCAMAALSAGVIAVSGTSWWLVGLIVSVTYGAVTTACLGRSLASWYLSQTRAPIVAPQSAWSTAWRSEGTLAAAASLRQPDAVVAER
jgi:hypothetical protein